MDQRAAGIAATGQNDMYVRESGSPGSPAVVFPHGVGYSGAMWGRHMDGEFHCLAPVAGAANEH
jgi:pimeloyl-ACP methyl ester carboxylesterase